MHVAISEQLQELQRLLSAALKRTRAAPGDRLVWTCRRGVRQASTMPYFPWASGFSMTTTGTDEASW